MLDLNSISCLIFINSSPEPIGSFMTLPNLKLRSDSEHLTVLDKSKSLITWLLLWICKRAITIINNTLCIIFVVSCLPRLLIRVYWSHFRSISKVLPSFPQCILGHPNENTNFAWKFCNSGALSNLVDTIVIKCIFSFLRGRTNF